MQTQVWTPETDPRNKTKPVATKQDFKLDTGRMNTVSKPISKEVKRKPTPKVSGTDATSHAFWEKAVADKTAVKFKLGDGLSFEANVIGVDRFHIHVEVNPNLHRLIFKHAVTYAEVKS